MPGGRSIPKIRTGVGIVIFACVCCIKVTLIIRVQMKDAITVPKTPVIVQKPSDQQRPDTKERQKVTTADSDRPASTSHLIQASQNDVYSRVLPRVANKRSKVQKYEDEFMEKYVSARLLKALYDV
jgi:hypothetical protein